jgi:hypothetical protein
MRTVAIIFSVISLVALSSCNQKTDSKALLKTRNQGLKFLTTANNHDFMTEFMGKCK